jgi:hypothetical protein
LFTHSRRSFEGFHLYVENRSINLLSGLILDWMLRRILYE